MQAVQTPAVAFTDPELASGQPDTNAMGMPEVFSGAFASVFRVSTPAGRRWAVKCFTREISDRDRRYRAISDQLSRMNRDWQVGFEYQPDGIRVAGQTYPIVKMEWVPDCKGLDRWLEANRFDSTRVLWVAGQLATIVADLEAATISHGDLQHGNLLVTPADQVRLIDYDGMFVPGLEQLGASENGHRNYQSPARSSSEFGPGLDRFSAWLIWCSLVAVAADASLWDQLHTDGDEKLLLGADDFLDLRVSPAITAMRASPYPQVTAVADVLERLLRGDLDDLPALDPKRYQGISEAAGAGAAPGPAAQWWQQSGASGATTGSVSGVPAWMTVGGAAPAPQNPGAPGVPGRPTAPATAAQPIGATAGAAWLSVHMPVPVVGFGSVSRRLAAAVRACVALAIASFVVAGTLAVIRPTASVEIGALGWFASLLSFATVVLLRRTWTRTTEYVARSEARAAAKDAAVAARDGRAEVTRLEEERARLVQAETDQMAALAKQRQVIRATEQAAHAAADEELRSTRASLGVELASLDGRERSDRATLLVQLKDSHVRERLEREQLRQGRVAGIGETLVWALSGAGIHTAADITDARISGGGGGRYGPQKTAQLRLANGSWVHIQGIGEVKAQSLLAWRRGVEAAARQTAPTQLPGAAASSVTAKYQKVRTDIAAKRSAADRLVVQRKQVATAVAQKAYVELDREIDRARTSSGTLRSQHDQLLVAARQAQTQREFKAAQTEAVRASFAPITGRRYVRVVLSGKAV